MTTRRNALLASLGLSVAPGLPAAAPSAGGRILADEFWADKNGVRLWVYRKRLEGAEPRPRLFCVHGSSYSGKTMFDLSVPTRDNYSMMDHFARLGYDVWTMDHEGYGHSQKTAGNSDIQSGVEDLKAAMAVVQRQGGGARLFRAVVRGAARGAVRDPASGARRQARARRIRVDRPRRADAGGAREE